MPGDNGTGSHPIAVRGLGHIVPRVSDLDAMIAFRAEARRGTEGAGLSMYLLDPERNTVELEGPAWI